LFSGIGGIDLGLDRAGWSCAGQVEIDPFCRKVLAKHWPDVPRHDDVRTAIEWWGSERRPRVRAVVGGYPCQPESMAGKRMGVGDPRWLWPEMARVIHALRPRWVIGENVDGHVSKGLRFVLRDLERLGYHSVPGTIRACEVGAPHPRQRVLTLAHSYGRRSMLGVRGELVMGNRDTNRKGDSNRWPDPDDWVEASFGDSRVADGVPRGMDRYRNTALGNAVVPAIAERAGRIINAIEEARKEGKKAG